MYMDLDGSVPFDPENQQLPHRFARRHWWITQVEPARMEAYRNLRYHELGKLSDDMLCTLGGGTVNAGLALLYQAPSFPGLSVTPWIQGAGDPAFVHDYLHDGIALPQRLHPALGITGSRTTYVPAIYAMQNTRYQSPIDGGTLGPQDPTYDQLPTGLSSDTRWTRNRWFDYSTPYRDVVLDHYFPTWPQSGMPEFKVGGWVYHDFIEPWHQSDRQYGWGHKDSGEGPHIATVSEPADVDVCWNEGKSPVFTQWPQALKAPAWSVPYGSFFDYFKRRLGVVSGPVAVDILLFGGWDTTSFYGHESVLYDALRGRT
ncbi:MAG: hypothetical protein HRF45_01940 [Fimbriimonadia bacterium]